MCLAVRKIHVFFKLEQGFLQTGRNILPIQIINDSSDDTNIKVIIALVSFWSLLIIESVARVLDLARAFLARLSGITLNANKIVLTTRRGFFSELFTSMFIKESNYNPRFCEKKRNSSMGNI